MANTKITNPELFNLGDSTSATQLPVMTTTERIAMTGLSVGETIFNSTTDKVEYFDGTKWYGINYEPAQPYQVDYLVVAGGGGAYYSGGGGGGYRTNVVGDLSGGSSTAEPAFTLVPEQVYTVTVGGGGPGGFRSSAVQLKGGDSTFDTITSIGGGKASNLWSQNGYPGGSGGGANVLENDFASTSGGAGTAGQGYRGGNASNGEGDVTAGGGGAGGRGGDLYGSSGWSGTPGGAGLVSSIDGLSKTRSKGGTGGVSVPANPYGANTGAGGQGPNNAGLSGVVILRMPTDSYSGTTTGEPTVTEIGVNTILTYNSSGTYTA